MRKPAAVVSVLLLGLLAVGVAEATLAALIVLFSTILKHYLQLTLPAAPFRPALAVYSAGWIASVAFTALCGLAAATWKFRRWRPSR